MKDMIDYTQVPYDYLMCLHEKCPQAETCLRQMAGQAVPAGKEWLKIVNPNYIATLSGNCSYFRPAATVRYAKGFRRLLGKLPSDTMRAIVSRLIDEFGRRRYYHYRKGELLLSPEEQKITLEIIEKCGIDWQPDFDSYIETLDW